MPFTLAHPAAVLPLFRRPFVASALVAGAVAPDLLYVGPIYRIATRQINGNFTLTLTHEFTSALWLDPLLALLLLAVFNLVLKRPLIALAPPALAGRLETPRRPFRIPSVSVLLWTVVSAVVGAITHVVWDSFTHGDGYFVRQFPGFFRAQVTGAGTSTASFSTSAHWVAASFSRCGSIAGTAVRHRSPSMSACRPGSGTSSTSRPSVWRSAERLRSSAASTAGSAARSAYERCSPASCRAV